jgi:hypothetical protein
MRKTLTSSTAMLLAALALPAMGIPAFAQTAAPSTVAPSAAAPAMPMATPPASDTTTAKPPARHAGQQKNADRQKAERWSPEERAKRVEAHIAKLHEELGITAAQETQWKSFAQVMRDNADKMAKGFETRGSHLAKMSAAQNMQSYADMAVQHAQDVQRLAVAFQSVYDALSPSQKATADTLFRAQKQQARHRNRPPHGPAAATPSKQ